MNTTEVLLDDLSQQNKNVCFSDGPATLTGGCAVIVIDPTVDSWGGFRSYSIGISEGSVTYGHGTGETILITFNFSAFKDDYCSASGGPGTHIPVECLRDTGLKIELDFWRWKDGSPGRENSVGYREYVPLFEYYQSSVEALVDSQPISQDEFNQFQSTIPVDLDCFTSDWVRDKNGLALYWKDVKQAFALSQPVSQTSLTLVVPVCFELSYHGLTGAVCKPNEYFIQPMQLFTPSSQPISSVDRHQHQICRVSGYYLHQGQP